MESILKTLDSLLQHVTFIRVFLVSILIIFAVLSLTLYENRQRVYDDFSVAKLDGDFMLKPPSLKGTQILNELTAKYPEIAMISLIDADPVANTRRVIARIIPDTLLNKIVHEKTDTNPTIGDGPLFGSDPTSNRQILSIMNGEFSCDPVSGSILANIFPQSQTIVKFSCRVPLPPAFNKATGWFTIHLKEMPKEKLDRLKFDSLSASLMYYNAEIATKGAKINE